MVWQPYSLLGPNCQMFAQDALNFILNGSSVEKALQALRSDKTTVLQAVQRDGMMLEHAADNLKSDEDIVWASVLQNTAAIRFASDKISFNKTVRGIDVTKVASGNRKFSGICSHY